MCGIAGVVGLAGTASEDQVRRMVHALRHRGPDGADVWVDPTGRAGLGHARLAVVELSDAGRQPMLSATGRFALTFNGEIYNHPDLRAALAAEGRAPSWRGTSDTETLVAGFEAWGIEATVRRTVGMFAFAVWDGRDHTVTIGRDRLGEKPLYYAWAGSQFLFGSELKALRQHPACPTEIDRDALASYMRFGYVPAPRSIFRGVTKLMPGTLLTVDPQGGRDQPPTPYWSLIDVATTGAAQPFVGTDREAIDALQRHLGDAVTSQQMSDVPLGAFLSGGVDSSVIVALMQAEASRPVHTFTIGFESAGFNEAPHARAVAQHLGTDHTELVVTAEQARAVIPQLPVLYDEPFSDSSQIPTFLVSQLARQRVTVSLSGDAGDELFGGYNRYAWASRLLSVPGPLRRTASAVLDALSPAQWDQAYARVESVLPRRARIRMPGLKAHKLAGVLRHRSEVDVYRHLISIWTDPSAVVVGGREPADLLPMWDAVAALPDVETRMMALDALGYLPGDILCKVDRAAMGVSLETRVPFLDHRVVQFAARVPLSMKIRDGEGKWIVRQLLDRFVPRELIDRPKMGFAVPIEAWLRGPLREWAEDLLDERRLTQDGFLHAAPVRALWAEHLSGRRDWQYHLWAVLMFQAWRAEWA